MTRKWDNIFKVFCFCCALTSAKAQRGVQLEVYFWNYSPDTLTVYAESQGEVWNREDSLTTEYESGDFYVPGNHFKGDETFSQYGIDYVSSLGAGGALSYTILGYGLYKIWNSETGSDSNYFYLDLRDANMSWPIDIHMKWDNNAYYWMWEQGCEDFTWEWIQSYFFHTTIGIWEI